MPACQSPVSRSSFPHASAPTDPDQAGDARDRRIATGLRLTLAEIVLRLSQDVVDAQRAATQRQEPLIAEELAAHVGMARRVALERDDRRCVGTEGLKHAIKQRVGACCVNEGERIALWTGRMRG